MEPRLDSKWVLCDIDELFAGDFVFHGPFGTEIRGIEGFKQFMAEFITAFPRFSYDD